LGTMQYMRHRSHTPIIIGDGLMPPGLSSESDDMHYLSDSE
jgi:hypothetical protein